MPEDIKQGFLSKLNPFKKKSLPSSINQGGWSWVVREPFAGAWQSNIAWTRETVLAYHAIFSCITLISSDISKLKIKLVKKDSDIWVDVPMTNYPVLVRPNGFQNRIQFIENWLHSKLSRGNAYILKGRERGKVTRLYVLNPDLVTPMVSAEGEVFYQLSKDDLSNTKGSVIVPASEIIHDRFNCLFHPLVGLSPIFASGLAAYGGLKMQENSARLFKNGARPAGILTAPGAISDETAARLKETWEANYGGENYGRTAVLGDDLKYQPLTVNAEQSQMIQQLELSAEIVCSTFHVPKYKVVGDPPSYNNIEALDMGYYSQCLQVLIESAELCLNEGLDIPSGQGVEFDLSGLLRMDSKSQVETLGQGINKAIYTPNEARKKMNLKPVTGGDSPYLQQQNYSLEALAKRDELPDPFNMNSPPPTPNPQQQPSAADQEKQVLLLDMFFKKEMKEIKYDF